MGPVDGSAGVAEPDGTGLARRVRPPPCLLRAPGPAAPRAPRPPRVTPTNTTHLLFVSKFVSGGRRQRLEEDARARQRRPSRTWSALPKQGTFLDRDLA